MKIEADLDWFFKHGKKELIDTYKYINKNKDKVTFYQALSKEDYTQGHWDINNEIKIIYEVKHHLPCYTIFKRNKKIYSNLPNGGILHIMDLIRNHSKTKKERDPKKYILKRMKEFNYRINDHFITKKDTAKDLKNKKEIYLKQIENDYIEYKRILNLLNENQHNIPLFTYQLMVDNLLKINQLIENKIKILNS